MTNRWLALLVLVSGLGACNALGPRMTGDWEVEVEDADDCTADLEVKQKKGELSGEADLACRLYFTVDGEVFYYDLEADGEDLEGEIDGTEFEIAVEFEDEVLGEIELVLIGELDGDDIEGEVEINGEYFGDFKGSR